MFYEIQLLEYNKTLGNFDRNLYDSIGFTVVVLQDFPICGKVLFMKWEVD